MTPPLRSPITPYLAVDGAHEALKFYKQAFAAEESELYEHEGRIGHVTLTINGGHIYLSDVFAEMGDGMARAPGPNGTCTAVVCLQVTDADSWFNRAISAGASIVSPLKDEFYGRNGKFRDPFGHLWSINGPVSELK